MRFLVQVAALVSASLVMSAANAATFNAPKKGVDVIGEVDHIRAAYEDTFVAIAREHSLAFTMLKYANPKVDPWLPGDGTRIKLPLRYILPNAPREGIVINQAEMRIYYYPPEGSKNAGKVITMPIGVGRQGRHTPLGETKIIQKNKNPTWNVPRSIWLEHKKRGDPIPKVVPPGPDNPLGHRAMRLGWSSYLIHGTNKPRGIGMQVSHGCIRLYPEDIKRLFSLAEVGTPVYVVNQPYKAGWNGQQIVLAAHPPLETKKSERGEFPSWTKVLVQAAKKHPKVKINWQRARKIVQEANGIPQPVTGRQGENDAQQAEGDMSRPETETSKTRKRASVNASLSTETAAADDARGEQNDSDRAKMSASGSEQASRSGAQKTQYLSN